MVRSMGIWKGIAPKILYILSVLLLMQQAAGCGPAQSEKPKESIEPKADYGQLRSQISTYIETKGGLVGVYFQDISSGENFGINQKEPITAASSIKAPIVLYLYEQVAAEKIDLKEAITYQTSDYSGGAGCLQFFATEGDKYSLGVLANLAITVSDNIAWKMLLRHLGRDNLADYFRSLGGETVYPEGRNISTARDLGLYLKGILDFTKSNPKLGEQLLDYMSHTIFDGEGIPVGVPSDIKVAHKVGTVGQVATDVGIVFLGKEPYILTVLTDGVGDNINDGFAVIEEISKMVYNHQKGPARDS
jgi:beta-lactamase class A